jgi:hypothetical protein
VAGDPGVHRRGMGHWSTRRSAASPTTWIRRHFVAPFEDDIIDPDEVGQ